MLRFTFASSDTALIDKFLKAPQKVMLAIADAMNRAMIRLQAYIVAEKLSGDPIKRRTGALADSVKYFPSEVQGMMVRGGVTAGGAGVTYARPLEVGAQPHTILPSNATALHFLMEGNENMMSETAGGTLAQSFGVFAKSVSHPGNRPSYYMRDSLIEQSGVIKTMLQEAMLKALLS